MKKLLSVVIALLLVFSLSSCSSKTADPVSTEASSGSQTEPRADENASVSSEAGSGSEGTISEPQHAETDISEMSAEELMSDLDRYQIDDLIFYVPKALNLGTDENAAVPENQFFFTGDHMGMIVGRVGEHDDLISGGDTEKMLNDQEFMVRLLGSGETVEDINGRYYSYAVTEYDDGNVVDTWTVLPDKNWFYLIQLRCSEDEWSIFHDVFALMIEKMEVDEK